MRQIIQIITGFWCGLYALPVWAQASAPSQKPSGSNFLLPLLASFAVIYFMMIRPQVKRERKQRDQLAKVEKGDEVITKGGVLGKVTNVAEKVLTLEIAEKTRIKIDRNFVHTVQKPN